MTMIKVTTALLAVSFLGACSAEMGAPEPVDEPVSQVTQKIAQSWNPRGLASLIVGMAMNSNGTTWVWLSTGDVFGGPWTDPMNTRLTPPLPPYTAPFDRRTISAVGIARNTGHTYTWYTNGKVSHGDVWNLGRYDDPIQGPLNFLAPINPLTGTRFRMDELIEVDVSDNGSCYYYWHSGTSTHATIFRSTGSSVNAASTAVPVNTPFPDWASIVGISFGTGSPALLYTFRVDANGAGQVNESNTSLQLMPPQL